MIFINMEKAATIIIGILIIQVTTALFVVVVVFGGGWADEVVGTLKYAIHSTFKTYN